MSQNKAARQPIPTMSGNLPIKNIPAQEPPKAPEPEPEPVPEPEQEQEADQPEMVDRQMPVVTQTIYTVLDVRPSQIEMALNDLASKGWQLATLLKGDIIAFEQTYKLVMWRFA